MRACKSLCKCGVVAMGVLAFSVSAWALEPEEVRSIKAIPPDTSVHYIVNGEVRGLADPAILYQNTDKTGYYCNGYFDVIPDDWDYADDLELLLPNAATTWLITGYQYATYAAKTTPAYNVESGLYRMVECTGNPDSLIDWNLGVCCTDPVPITGTGATTAIAASGPDFGSVYYVTIPVDPPVSVDKYIWLALDWDVPDGYNHGFIIGGEADIGWTDDVAAWQDDVQVSGCPGDSLEMVSCGDDTCGVGAGMSCIGDPDAVICPRATPEILICEGQSYLIRMGGWAEDYGSGRMTIKFVPSAKGCGDPPCSECGKPAVRPLAEDCRDIPPGTRCDPGKEDACVDDDDCAWESHCVPPPDEGLCQDGETECSVSAQNCEDLGATGPCDPKFDAVCYAPKTRYLSIAANPDQADYTMRRVKLQDGYCEDDPGLRCVTDQNCVAAGAAGPCIPDHVVLGWVDEPYEAAGLWLAEIVAGPVSVQTWPDVVHVIGCEIAHASLSDSTEKHCKPNTVVDENCVEHCYIVQAISASADVEDEGEYSEELMLCTNSTWGDTVTTGPGGLLLPADGVCGLADIMAAIAYFQGDLVAPLTWLDIAPSTLKNKPDQVVGLGDIMGAIAGFQGSPYPGGLGPKDCSLP